MATAFRGTMALRYFRALLIARTSAHPRSQSLGGSKGGGCGSYFRDDLLRRIDSQARNLGQPLDGGFVLPQQGRYLLLPLVPWLCSRNGSSGSAIGNKRRYTGWSSVQAPSASVNCASLARRRWSAKAARARDWFPLPPARSACA